MNFDYSYPNRRTERLMQLMEYPTGQVRSRQEPQYQAFPGQGQRPEAYGVGQAFPGQGQRSEAYPFGQQKSLPFLPQINQGKAPRQQRVGNPQIDQLLFLQNQQIAELQSQLQAQQAQFHKEKRRLEEKIKKSQMPDSKATEGKKGARTSLMPIRRGKDERKKKVRRLTNPELRILTARMVFIFYYVRTLQRDVKKIRNKHLEIHKTQGVVMDRLAEIYEGAMEKGMLQFLNSQQDLKLEIGEDSLNKKKTNTVYDLLMGLVTGYSELKASDLSPEVFRFLSTICLDGAFPPQDYFIDFEVERLEFNTLGALGKLSENQAQMILMMLIYLRILVATHILRAWTYHPAQDNTEILFLIQRNSIVLGSVLQHILISQFEGEKKFRYEERKLQLHKLKRVNQVSFDQPNPRQKTLVKDLLPLTQSQQYLRLLQEDKVKYQKLVNTMVTHILSIRMELLQYQASQEKESKKMSERIQKYMFDEIYSKDELLLTNN